jgi:class 3 adenylate cyclase/RecA/RadA recombinase
LATPTVYPVTESPARDRDRRAAVHTFLIADVRGYTSFTAEHGDEAASRLTAKFAEVAREGVGAWAGSLVETRGDEVLAAFDSVRNALRCAVELQAAFAAETLADPSLPLAVGIGVAAGEAVAVGDGYRGAALNVAARLCSTARGGEVIARADLVHLAGTMPDLGFGEVGPLTLKGLDEPVQAVRVESVGQPAPTPASVAGTPAKGTRPSLPPELDPIVPLAGRNADLSWLAWHWRRAGHGAGRVVVVSGPPGMGKTRLAAELAGRAHAEGATVSYLPAARGADELPFPDSSKPEARLLIVDDLDAAPPSLGEAVLKLGQQVAGQRWLVLVTHRQEAAPALLAVAERLASPERRRLLQPLGPDAIQAIAALYTGQSAMAVPLPEALTETGGVPAAIHRWSSAWARRTASERLGASATRTSAGRRGLRAAETELMGSYAALALARDRTELYGADRPANDDEAQRPPVEVCPYKGLASFEAADADFFFGRERLVAELVTRLVGTGFLALVGASGSGKSSALRAGLLPALAGGVLPGSDAWRQVALRPGEHPLTEFGRALARLQPASVTESDDPDPSALLEHALADIPSGGRLVVVVDQFEEVFNATRAEDEKEAFIDLLTSEREGLKVVVCLRADHYGHCAAYPELAKLLGNNQVLVGPPTRVELAEVIEHPAQRVGLRVEDGLTDALLTDLGDEPGSLPLLSTALLELWQSRDHGRLTLAAYRASGGVHAAVARLAETAYRGLDEDGQRIARSVFLRLAGPGEGEGVVRRRVPLSEFDTESDPETAAVIDALTNARMLSSGDGYVEVAHEALMREWPRLRAWLEEDSAGHQLRLHLTDAAREWDERGRPPDELYRGARLAAALDWQPEHDHELNALERDFLAQSRLVSERQAERQRTINRRLRMLLAGATVFLVVAVGAGAFAAYQAQVAGEAENFARSRELAASAIAALGQDPALSKLLALEAASIANPPIESLAALHTAWDADRIVARYQWPADKPVGDLMTDIDPSGRYIVASGFLFAAPHDRLEVFDLQQDAVAWSFQSADSSIAVGNGYFTPDGSRVVFGAYREQTPPAGAGSAADDAGVYVRDPATGTELNHFSIGPCGGAVVAASNVSALVLIPIGCTGSHVELELVDLASGETRLLTSHEYGNDEGAISADGQTVAYTQNPQSNDQVPETYVVDVASGVQTRVDPPAVDPTSLFVHDVDASGQYLLLSQDGLMKVWDVAAAQVVAESPPVVGGVPNYANFSRDGSTVYWTSQDGMLYEWQPANQSSHLLSYPVPRAGFPSSTDAGLVLVPSWGTNDALLIDTTQHPEIADLPPPSGCGAYFPEGLNVAGGNVSVTTLCNGTPLLVARVADRASLTVGRVLPGGAVMAISPDGSRLARQTGKLVQPDDPNSDIEAGPLEIVDVGSGATLQLEGLCRYNWSGEGGESHQPAKNPGCAEFPAEPFELYTWRLRWSPDGSMLVAVDADQAYWAVWNTHDGSLIRASTALARPGAFDARFTADSSHLVVSYTGSSASYGATVADTLESISTTSWTVDVQRTLPTQGLRLELVGLTDDGATILAVSGSTGTGVERAGTGDQGIYWLAADTLQETRPSRPSLHVGTLNTVTLNDQGTLLATGSADGTVSVWDATDGRLVHQLNFPNNEISSLGFLTDSHLGVLLDDGNLKVVTTDPDELLRIVRQSLTRGFTAAECERYNFDPCPTLQQMISGT